MCNVNRTLINTNKQNKEDAFDYILLKLCIANKREKTAVLLCLHCLAVRMGVLLL